MSAKEKCDDCGGIGELECRACKIRQEKRLGVNLDQSVGWHLISCPVCQNTKVVTCQKCKGTGRLK
jgi:hypothetical protein